MIFAVILICIVANVCIFRNRPWVKSLIGLIGNIVAGGITILLTKAIASLLIRPTTALVLSNLPNEIGSSDVYTEAISGILSALIAVVIFPLIYLFLYIIFKIPEYFIFKSLRLPEKTEETGLKAASMSITGVNCLLFFVILFSTVSGLVSSASNSAYELRNIKVEDDETTEKSIRTMATGIKMGADISGLNLMAKLGGNVVYDAVSGFRFEDYKTTLNKESVAIVKTIKTAVPAYLALEDGVSEKSINAIKALKNSVFESDFLKTTFMEFIHEASSAWLKGKRYIEIEAPGVAENYKEAFNALLTKLSTATEEQVESLLDMCIKLLKKASEYNLFSTEGNVGDNAIEAFKDPETIKDIITSVDEDNVDIISPIVQEAVTSAVQENGSGDFKVNPEVVGDLVGIIVDKMATLSQTEAIQEAEAVSRVVEIANELSTLNQKTEKEIVALGKELFSLATESRLIGESISDYVKSGKEKLFLELTSADKTKLESELKTYYENVSGGIKDKAKEVVNDIAVMFGLDKILN